MAKLIQSCPMCHEKLTVSTLHCGHCGLSLQNDFELNEFNYLTEEQMNFLVSFLRYEGNLRMLQEQFGISYPAVKKRLQDLLHALNLSNKADEQEGSEANINLANVSYQDDSIDASDIVKRKLTGNGGHAIVHSITGKPYEIRIGTDGKSIVCQELPPYEFSVLDSVVECLVKNGGSAKKGNGRNCKLGEELCNDATVVGYIGKHYSGKCEGESVFDPVFILAAILEWAEVAKNCRGYLELTPSYLKKMNSR